MRYYLLLQPAVCIRQHLQTSMNVGQTTAGVTAHVNAPTHLVVEHAVVASLVGRITEPRAVTVSVE